MKMSIFTIWVLFMALFSNNATAEDKSTDFSFTSLSAEQPIKLSDYKDHVIMIVNTASKCGFTGQYESLEELYQTFKDQKFVVIGIPSDDFGGQELDSNKEVANFCKINYGVTFPMASITKVKGKEAHQFYAYARKELGFGTAPKWNFHKYLIGRNGKLVDYFHSTTKPNSPKILNAIESELIK
jgi:glutathione peroxidase